MIDFSNFQIIVDTREQHPWEFSKMEKTIAKLDTGDYSLKGLEDILYRTKKVVSANLLTILTEKRFKDVIERLSNVQHSLFII